MRAVAVALLLAGLGAACRSQPDVRAATLVAALNSDPGHLNPAITSGGGVHTASGLLYNGLLSLDDSLAPSPELAIRWETEEGGARYRFHLRSGVRWHDGRPFTSGDVKFTFDEALLKFHSRTRASLGGALAGIDAPDDSTVVFRFRRPYAPLLQQLDVVEAPIIPRHVYEGTDLESNPANRAPIGTGPYRFESYTSDVEIRYRANEAYFAGKPRIERVVMRIIPDPGMSVVALEAGEVDWLFSIPGPDRSRLTARHDIHLFQTTINPGGSNCVQTLTPNLDRPILADLRVRRAMAHAIDRGQFVERVLFGDGRAATAPISSGIRFAHAGDIGLPAFDLELAGRLLDSAGWRRSDSGIRIARGVTGVRDGAPLQIEFQHFPTFAPYGELLRAQLRRIGLDLVLRPLEPAVFVSVVFKERNFDLGIVSYCNGNDPEIGVRRQYHSSSIGPVPFSNAAGYRNHLVDSLFEAAGSTLDRDNRRRLYHEIQEIAVRDLPYIWLVETAATRAFRSRCSGFGSAAHFAAAARCDP